MVADHLEFWKNKKVFVTGHTGFKGSWLMSLLHQLNCEVFGYALEPASDPNHFSLLKNRGQSVYADIRDLDKLKQAVKESRAEIVFHLAAQSLVRTSYRDPHYTYEVNVMGSLNLLEAVRMSPSVRAVVMVTTDKVYANREEHYAYREDDKLGGHDMYSSSKACCEILIDSYRLSFLKSSQFRENQRILIASLRAGNVIGGGDWSEDRLIPDLVRAAAAKQTAEIRNPLAVRPWQHVLDCLNAYLMVGAELFKGNQEAASSWNVAPEKAEVCSVEQILQMSAQAWNEIQYNVRPLQNAPHEANLLMLDNTKIKSKLNWTPVYSTPEAVALTFDWYKKYYKSGECITEFQVEKFLAA